MTDRRSSKNVLNASISINNSIGKPPLPINEENPSDIHERQLKDLQLELQAAYRRLEDQEHDMMQMAQRLIQREQAIQKRESLLQEAEIRLAPTQSKLEQWEESIKSKEYELTRVKEREQALVEREKALICKEQKYNDAASKQKAAQQKLDAQKLELEECEKSLQASIKAMREEEEQQIEKLKKQSSQLQNEVQLLEKKSNELKVLVSQSMTEIQSIKERDEELSLREREVSLETERLLGEASRLESLEIDLSKRERNLIISQERYEEIENKVQQGNLELQQQMEKMEEIKRNVSELLAKEISTKERISKLVIREEKQCRQIYIRHDELVREMEEAAQKQQLIFQKEYGEQRTLFCNHIEQFHKDLCSEHLQMHKTLIEALHNIRKLLSIFNVKEVQINNRSKNLDQRESHIVTLENDLRDRESVIMVQETELRNGQALIEHAKESSLQHIREREKEVEKKESELAHVRRELALMLEHERQLERTRLETSKAQSLLPGGPINGRQRRQQEISDCYNRNTKSNRKLSADIKDAESELSELRLHQSLGAVENRLMSCSEKLFDNMQRLRDCYDKMFLMCGDSIGGDISPRVGGGAGFGTTLTNTSGNLNTVMARNVMDLMGDMARLHKSGREMVDQMLALLRPSQLQLLPQSPRNAALPCLSRLYRNETETSQRDINNTSQQDTIPPPPSRKRRGVPYLPNRINRPIQVPNSSNNSFMNTSTTLPSTVWLPPTRN